MGFGNLKSLKVTATFITFSDGIERCDEVEFSLNDRTDIHSRSPFIIIIL